MPTLSTIKTTCLRVAALVLLHCLNPVHAQTPGTAKPNLESERAKQDSIYHGTGDKLLEVYVVDRSLADYSYAFSTEFDRALGALGPDDRWLDIGAGMGLAILDYYSPGYVPPEQTRRHDKKARSVAMSIEDRRTPYWHQMAARLEANQMQYMYNKRLREYSNDELGRFQLITDVIGGFSYSENLSLFMEKTLGFLTVNGNFFTLLQDVRNEQGTNKPHYANAPFLTEIKNAGGEDLKVCTWLKSISCVEVTCQARPDWRPPVEVYRIRKTCNEVVVPALEMVHFVAGTPPERFFRLKAPASVK